jgi:hypothetical protein
MILLTAFLVILGFSYAMFDNRYAVYEFFRYSRIAPPASVVKLSKSSVTEIKKAVAQSDLVVAIQITLVDFQRNTRVVVYTEIDDPALRDLYTAFMEKAPAELPLFNTDMINNQRLVNLVNGEFVCTPYIDTLGAKLLPQTVPYLSTLCAGPVPPLYGRFAGIIGIYLARSPTPVEIEQIKTLSKNLGLMVYNNDLR